MIIRPKPFALILATSALLAAPAIAQNADDQNSTIVVEAPATLNDKDTIRWNKLNREAIKLEKRLSNLQERLGEDKKELARAESRLERAREEHRDEEKDLDKTEDRIKDTQDDLEDLVKDRRKLSAG